MSSSSWCVAVVSDYETNTNVVLLLIYLSDTNYIHAVITTIKKVFVNHKRISLSLERMIICFLSLVLHNIIYRKKKRKKILWPRRTRQVFSIFLMKSFIFEMDFFFYKKEQLDLKDDDVICCFFLLLLHKAFINRLVKYFAKLSISMNKIRDMPSLVVLR
jgi:hypothetical protein